jgi:hypothetical protein
MAFSEAERDVIASHSGLVLSHTMTSGEIWRAYRSQMLWVALTIVLGVLFSSLYPAARDSVDCESYSSLVLLGASPTNADCTTRDMRDAQNRQHDGLQITVGAAVGVEVAIFIAFLVVSAAAHAHAGTLRRNLSTPSPKVEKHLRAFLAPICTRIGVTREFVLRIDKRAHHWAPSVAEDGTGVILVVPLGLLKLLATDSRAAEAILAHELGHIHEGDSWIFPTQAAHARIFNLLVAPSVGGLFIVSLLTSSPITISRWALIGAVVSARRAKQHLYAARLASEERADAYASIVSGGPELSRVLDEYVEPKPRASKFHPSVSQRKLSMSESLRQLQRLCTPVRASPTTVGGAVDAFDLADLLNARSKKPTRSG